MDRGSLRQPPPREAGQGKEELNLIVDVATPIDLYDRPTKGCVAVLFRVILKPKQAVRVRKGEIEQFAFRHRPPPGSTPSLKYFWQRAQLSFEPLSMFGRR